MFSQPAHIIAQLGLSDGMHVADLGSGTGHFSCLAADLVGSGGRVYACDVQRGLLSRLKGEAAERGLGNVEIIWADIERGTKLRDALVDRAIAANVLFQIADKERFAREAYRILKPGGRLAVIDWSDSHGGTGPHPDHVFAEREARDLFQDYGFRFEQDIDAGSHHYGMILGKQ